MTWKEAVRVAGGAILSILKTLPGVSWHTSALFESCIRGHRYFLFSKVR